MLYKRTLLILAGIFLLGFSLHKLDETVTNDLGDASPLPLPTTLPLDEYEKVLYDFLEKREYENLGWKHDKEVRNTGPFIDNTPYGVHPAVVIYYSPGVMKWLRNNRQGVIPDGEMIVKVMYETPAQRYGDISIADINDSVYKGSKSFDGWTVMVRDSKGSKDGWFWSYYAFDQGVDMLDKYPFNYPNSGFGNYCVRCHASAEKEFTFSSLTNIEGEPGDPITYYVDESWKKPQDQEYKDTHEKIAEEEPGRIAELHTKRSGVNKKFLQVFNSMKAIKRADVKSFPPVTYDHVYSGPDGPGQFLTSDQCLSCHDGQSGKFLPNMIRTEGEDIANLSPFGEWRWSMMGLAGRDPIFYAQLESEKTLHSGALADTIQDLCLSCHGVMGQRQFHIDYGMDTLFGIKEVYNRNLNDPNHKYGSLAREGISCMSCHQIIDDGKSLEEIETGKFVISKPGEVHGPFKNPPKHAMDTALGIIPIHSEYVKSSRLCGSCHTINLPVFNSIGKKVGTHYEQATYLEWLNSSYQNEYKPFGKQIETCQDCHMPSQYPFREGEPLAFKIANIQDQDYPEADHLAPAKDIKLETREEYRRHTLLGINIYGLQMFSQFDSILGVRKRDYMTGSANGLPTAIASSDRLAKQHSVRVEIAGEPTYKNGQLSTKVKLTNLAGHRFPSGVGFRRAFLQFAVLGSNGDTLWASGRTNSVGVVVDENGKILPSEFLERNEQGKQQYEPHYTSISQQDQVQIYQELTLNPEGVFTTSFVAIDSVVKDNRLLPLGWTEKGPPGFTHEFAEATSPHGKVLKDKLYMSGVGQDEIEYIVKITKSSLRGAKVVATLYYQSIPPYYLKQRFETAKGPAGQRLYYMASNLETEGTPIEGWKLATGTAQKQLSIK